MNTFIWVVQAALALFFLFPGFTKLIKTKGQLTEMGMLKPGDSVAPVRFIGTMEILGSVGLILPWLLQIMPVLTPVAAVGFCIIMVGAVAVHASKKDFKVMPLLVTLFAFSALVAWYRF